MGEVFTGIFIILMYHLEESWFLFIVLVATEIHLWNHIDSWNKFIIDL
jgi:hypothetical protein